MHVGFIEKETLVAEEKNEEEEVVEQNSKLKELLVEYVGKNNINIKNEEVTVEEIVETMAAEFPEFLLTIAEENWIRGYHQALHDVELGEKMISEDDETTKDR